MRYTHELPEWSDPNGSSYPIDAREIIRSAGVPDVQIEEASAQAESIWNLQRASAIFR
jgi:hypothetical protein